MVAELLDQIDAAATNGNYFLALFGALAIPSICGALESDDGEDNRDKYAVWFDKWIGPMYGGVLTGVQCYSFRCGMLHQGRAVQRGLGYDRVLFLEPQFAAARGMKFHRNILNDALNLDLVTFCTDVTAGARKWLQIAQGSPNYTKNYELAFRRFAGGLPPFIVGAPVVTSGGPPRPAKPRRPLPDASTTSRGSFPIYLSLTDAALEAAANRSSDGTASTWVNTVVRNFTDPLLKKFLDARSIGQAAIHDEESNEDVMVRESDLPPSMMIILHPDEKPPEWLREFHLDPDLVLGIQRAFQITTLIDTKLGRPARWGTVNEMVSKLIETELTRTAASR